MKNQVNEGPWNETDKPTGKTGSQEHRKNGGDKKEETQVGLKGPWSKEK